MDSHESQEMNSHESQEMSSHESQERNSHDTLADNTSKSVHDNNNTSLDEKARMINSPDSNDSGIQADDTHLRGPINENIYATVDKTKKTNNVKKATTQEKASDEIDALPPPEAPPKLTDLPPGWEKHEDENGAYYWHIKSGTIQRDPPPPPPPETQRQTSNSSQSSNGSIPTTPGNGQNFLQEFEGHALKYAAESVKSLSKASTQESLSNTSSPEAEKKIRFAVRSLGWVRIAEEDLTPDKSSKAVNKCIVDLSLGRNDINDVVGRWGDGKDLYMELDNEHLTLFDPTDMTLLNRQPIQSIRVWGVGRDNGRDFAYVARDRSTRKHMCHVFRCDTPARQIANTLRDICKKIMLERSMQQQIAKQTESNTGAIQRMAVSRPNNLPNLEKAGEANGKKITFEQLYKNTSFPTPMEEPKKVLRCHYLGTAQVPKSTGVDVLNAALETVHRTVPEQNWVECNIGIAPSTITVCDCENEDNILAECRVRFLSFMGIAMSNVKLGGFIMHSAEDQYVAHVFHCDPSAGALCKTIEAACKLRYQKCLDAHPTAGERHKQMQNQGQKAGLTASLKSGVQRGVSNVMGMFKKRGS
ncbi:unnamed protein product [Owenia fusiformis]|uniref:Uncharacterized protein n=1 Tax=Owenia fusiformis TaxID=6347 RepID=A0A8J1THG4_OWEFU|nr:unnamed protein product [Owenia fusiformis]